MRSVAVILACLFATQVYAKDMYVVRKISENKFVSAPGIPSCVTQAVESGDPANGPSVVLFKAKTGCAVPWHSHTPVEQIMVVRGRMQMKDRRHTKVLGTGGYMLLPSKHVHQVTCLSACTGFLVSSAAIDIHYVNQAGKKITAKKALAKKSNHLAPEFSRHANR